jgi:subtilisin
MAKLMQYILLPRRGFAERGFLAGLPRPVVPDTPSVTRSKLAGRSEFKIIHSIQENGPQLVEMDAVTAREVLSRTQMRAMPVLHYPRPGPKPALLGVRGTSLPYTYAKYTTWPHPQGKSKPSSSKRPAKVSITITDRRGSPKGISEVMVAAFSDFSLLKGDEEVTGRSGKVDLQLSAKIIERLYCYPPNGYWGAFLEDIPTVDPIKLGLAPLDLRFTDAVRHYYANSRFDSTRGVKVGVIDSGVGPHRDLNVGGGRNCVTGEPDDDYTDLDFHGTHVAGLIGAKGNPRGRTPGLRGLAPGVMIYSYRVFSGAGATNYSLLEAIIHARADGCDLINLSIEDGPNDPVLQEAIEDARNSGMLVIVSAGNDGRRSVNYPAAYRGATAVSAMGREGTFPEGALEEAQVHRPPNSQVDPKEFIAEFSNVGPEIAVTGLGVGVMSTMPGNRYGLLSGTSMAAPVVTGAAACLLSRNPDIYQMRRDRARSDAIERLLLDNCVPRGFGPEFEGAGLPDPAKV